MRDLSVTGGPVNIEQRRLQGSTSKEGEKNKKLGKHIRCQKSWNQYTLRELFSSPGCHFSWALSVSQYWPSRSLWATASHRHETSHSLSHPHPSPSSTEASSNTYTQARTSMGSGRLYQSVYYYSVFQPLEKKLSNFNLIGLKKMTTFHCDCLKRNPPRFHTRRVSMS